MVLWVMGMLVLGALKMLGLAVVALVQYLLVNLLVEPLGMGIKVMGTVVTVEMMDHMGIQLGMVLLEDVLGALQTVMLVVLVEQNYRGVAVATWGVDMVMQMEILGMEMQRGDLSNHKLLEIMGLLKQMVLMVDRLDMVVVMVVLRLEKPNNSDL
jgi:hypothetical protein